MKSNVTNEAETPIKKSKNLNLPSHVGEFLGPFRSAWL